MMNRVDSSGLTLGDFLSLDVLEAKKKPNKKGRVTACPVSEKTSNGSDMPDRVNKSPLNTRSTSTVESLQASLSTPSRHNFSSLTQPLYYTDKVIAIVTPSVREASPHEVEIHNPEVKISTSNLPSDMSLFENKGQSKQKRTALSNKGTPPSTRKVSHDQALCESNHLDLKLKKYGWLPGIKTKSLEHKKCFLDILREKEKLAKEILKGNKDQSVEDLFGRDVFVIPSIGEKGYIRMLGLTAGDLLRWKLEDIFLVFTEASEKDKPIWYENGFPLVSPAEYPFLENERKFMELHKELSASYEPSSQKIIPLLALF